MTNRAANATAETKIQLSAKIDTNQLLCRACKSANRSVTSKPPSRTPKHKWTLKVFSYNIFTSKEPIPQSDETNMNEVMRQDTQLDFPIIRHLPKK